jgi:VCBS repeat-containing protein
VTGTGTPTGVVELMTDSSEISQQAQLPMSLSSGSFSANNITTLPGGTYHVWGQYSGDSTNAASTSAKTTITVSPENSGIFFLTTTPTSGGIQILTDPTSTTSSNIPYGTELTLFGLVAPSTQLAAFESCEVGNGTCPVFTPPTGTVTFQDQGATINAAVVNSEADAEFSYPFGVGTHSFTAQYSGDNSYNASSATAQTLTVVPSAPFLGLNIASNNAAAQITSGQATILHVYAGNNYNAGSPVVAPTGSVTLTGLPPNVNTAITVPLVPAFLGNSASYGVGSVPINITAPNGNYPVTIRYPGDSNYTAASTQVGVQVLAAATGLTSTTTASTSASATSAAAAVTVTVTVTGQSGHAAPTGTLSLFSSAVGIGVVTLPTVASGSSVSTSFKLNSAVLVQGNNLISIWYSGDSTYLPSSADITVTNSMADFSLTPASSVAGVPGSGVTTDLISLASLYGYSGGVNLSCSAPAGVTCSLTSPTVTLAAGGVGSSTLNINTSGVSTTGSYPILVTASDAGTGTIVHTLSVTANVTSLPSGGSFGLTNSGTITLASPGASGTATVTVTPTGGFTGSVALSCGVTSSPAGAVKGPTCSVSSPVSVTGTTAGTATLTVNTVSSAVHGAPLEGIFGFGGAAVAMLLFFGLPRRRAWRGVLGMVFAAALMLGASGCGSGSSNGGTNTGTPPPTNNGTTFGSYNITVTGTSGSITTTTVVTVVVN